MRTNVMGWRRGFLTMCVLGAGAVWMGQAASAPAVPTMEQLKEQAGKGEHREVLKGVMRALELKGDAAAGYDRYELLMIRGESQLQIKELQASKATFAAAEKLAEEGGKAELAAKAGAMEKLLSKSTAFTYKPRTGEVKEAVSILDLKTRPRVMLLLLADEMEGVKGKYEAAKKAKSLPPVMVFAKEAKGIRALELAVEGNNTKTTEMFADLAKHAAGLMDTEAEAMGRKVEAIKQSAEKLVSEQVDYVDPRTGNRIPQTKVRQRGMTEAERTSVRQLKETCKMFAPAAKELSAALGAPASTFEGSVKKAFEVEGKADRLLLTDYTVPVR